MQFLIDFVQNTSDADIQAYLTNNGCTVLKEWDNFDKIFLVECASIPPSASIVERIVEESTLKIKPLDYMVDSYKYSHKDPNLPQIQLDTNSDQDWWKVFSFVKPAFDQPSMTITKKGKGITVYMMDSGIDASHPEFVDASIVNLYSVTTNDFSDNNGHGTALSSVVVGKTVGITEATLKVVKIFDPNHQTLQSEFLDALDAVANDHTPGVFSILNCSWIIEKNEWVEHKLALLIDQGVFVICAAGNQGTAIQDVTPAGMVEVITVGAYNKELRPCNFSNYTGGSMISVTGGDTNHGELDGWAPGELIWAAGPNGQYGYVAGTSIAAAITSAITACNLSDFLKPDGTIEQYYETFVIKPEITSGMYITFSREGLLEFQDPKYNSSRNYLVTLRDNTILPHQQELTDVIAYFRVNQNQAGARLYNHFLTDKIEWVDNLPSSFYLINEGNVCGNPTSAEGPADGEEYKLYTIRYKRYNTDGTVDNCTLSLYVAAELHDPGSLPPDHPINVMLQGICTGFPTICLISGSPEVCTNSCTSGNFCCTDIKMDYECLCTDGGGGGGGTCFAGETLITLADGTKKPIEMIMEGEKILAYNFITEEQEVNIVEHIHIRTFRDAYEYTLDDGTSMIVTDDHPLYVLGKGWASMNPRLTMRGYKSLRWDLVAKLEVGDEFLSQDNIGIKVVDIKRTVYTGAMYTFNNKYKSSPTYYANGVLAF